MKTSSEELSGPQGRIEHHSKIAVRARDLVHDIKSGVADFDLMEKYDLSLLGLKSVFKKLVTRGFITQEEIDGRRTPGKDTVDLDDPRQGSRRRLRASVAIFEEGDQANNGVVWDVSQTGIGTRGLETEVNEIKTLIIRPDMSTRVSPFRITVGCRWCRREETSGGCVAGFEILAIGEEDFHQLRKLLVRLTVEPHL
ncbi:MAG: hypothetical protein AB1646_09020 [Thermodesulfobacteriota bacterium]